MAEDFSLLENIVQKNIAETSDSTKFDWTKFIAEMEVGFTQFGFREQSRGGVDNILIIKWLPSGDYITGTGALRELRRNFPRARITLLSSRGVLEVMSERCPYVNEVITFGDVRCNVNDPTDLLKWAVEFSKKNLWHKRYRLAMNLKHWTMSWLELCIFYLCGAQERIAYVNCISTAIQTVRF